MAIFSGQHGSVSAGTLWRPFNSALRMDAAHERLTGSSGCDDCCRMALLGHILSGPDRVRRTVFLFLLHRRYGVCNVSHLRSSLSRRADLGWAIRVTARYYRVLWLARGDA